MTNCRHWPPPCHKRWRLYALVDVSRCSHFILVRINSLKTSCVRRCGGVGGRGVGGGLLYLWPQVRLVGLGYRHSKLLTQRTQVLQRQKELQVELSSLRQLRRIEDIAAQHLGLRPPQATQVIYVRSGQ